MTVKSKSKSKSEVCRSKHSGAKQKSFQNRGGLGAERELSLAGKNKQLILGALEKIGLTSAYKSIVIAYVAEVLDQLSGKAKCFRIFEAGNIANDKQDLISDIVNSLENLNCAVLFRLIPDGLGPEGKRLYKDFLLLCCFEVLINNIDSRFNQNKKYSGQSPRKFGYEKVSGCALRNGVLLSLHNQMNLLSGISDVPALHSESFNQRYKHVQLSIMTQKGIFPSMLPVCPGVWSDSPSGDMSDASSVSPGRNSSGSETEVFSSDGSEEQPSISVSPSFPVNFKPVPLPVMPEPESEDEDSELVSINGGFSFPSPNVAPAVARECAAYTKIQLS